MFADRFRSYWPTPASAGDFFNGLLKEGALVKQGDLLVTVDPAPYAAEVDRAEAQVAAAQARVSYTRSELDRSTRLLQESAIAQREHDERQNAHREADANLRAAQAALQTARLNLSYTQVRAPVSNTRYRDGLVSQLELLDARRSELRNRREALQVRTAQYTATVGLIRALGGDWGEGQGAVPPPSPRVVIQPRRPASPAPIVWGALGSQRRVGVQADSPWGPARGWPPSFVPSKGVFA